MSHVTGFAPRHFVLLFFIMILAVVVVVFLNFPTPTTYIREKPLTSQSDSEIWQEPLIESPGFVADALVKQNVVLKKTIDEERYRGDQLKKNVSAQENIIKRQNELIIKMHERLNAYKAAGTEILSPSDWITPEQIIVTDNQIIIEIPNAHAGSIIDTKSETPILNANTTTIEIDRKSTRLNSSHST
jgi:hypothetical protein